MGLYDVFWDDTIWFPANSSGRPYGWADLANKPGSNVYYPQFADLCMSIPLAAVFVCVRLILERCVSSSS